MHCSRATCGYDELFSGAGLHSATRPQVYVVDTGRVKSVRYRESTGTSSLQEQFISRGEAKQRMGRAGRVRPGTSQRGRGRPKGEKHVENHRAETNVNAFFNLSNWKQGTTRKVFAHKAAARSLPAPLPSVLFLLL